MKKSWLLVLLPLCLLGCGYGDVPCPVPEEQWLAVGFYRSGTTISWRNELPLDTLFTSVYPVGSNAELRHRRIENFLMLPLPVKGGPVAYVFRQGDRLDTLSLDLISTTRIDATECGVLVQLDSVMLVQRETTLRADSILFGPYFPYYGSKAAHSNLAIFVP